MRTMDIFPTDASRNCSTKQRVGVNQLKNMLPDLSQMSGIGVRYTNHSLRATAITHMFNKGVPEKIFAETSAHRSTKALRFYERTCVEQQVVTAVINSTTTKMKEEEKKEDNQDKENVVPTPTPVTPQNFSGNLHNKHIIEIDLPCVLSLDNNEQLRQI